MQTQTALLLLILPFPALVSATPESAQLALALKQLDGVKTSQERARTSASRILVSLRVNYASREPSSACKACSSCRALSSTVSHSGGSSWRWSAVD